VFALLLELGKRRRVSSRVLDGRSDALEDRRRIVSSLSSAHEALERDRPMLELHQIVEHDPARALGVCLLAGAREVVLDRRYFED